MLLNYIYFEGRELNICRYCVDNIASGRKSDKSKKVGYSTVSEVVELEEDEEEVEVKLLGGGGDKLSIMSVVYPRGTVIVSSLGYFFICYFFFYTLLSFPYSIYWSMPYLRVFKEIEGRGA